MIVNLQEAKAHLRYDGDENDAEIEILIAAAQSVIFKHIDPDDAIKQNPPPALKQAALLLIGYWDENRAAESGHGWFLPQPVLALLTPYRLPTAI